MRENSLVSILVPVYNLEDKISYNINFLIDRVSSFLNNVEIIISGDGSVDNTQSVIRNFINNFDYSLHSNIKKIIGIYNKENNGKGYALKRATEIANGEYIVFCDSDMEIDPIQIKTFFDIMKKENADVVIGSKRHKDSKVNYSNTRKVISFIYFLFVKIFFSLPIQDTQTGLKLFRREAIINIFPRVLVKAFAYDLEVLVACHSNNKKIVSAPVIVNPNRHFGFIRFSVLWRTFIDTIAIFYRLYFIKFYRDLFDELKDEDKLVSIIIPLKCINDYIKEELEYLLIQTYNNFEVIILPDSYIENDISSNLFKDKRVRIMSTGSLAPALKRAKGVVESSGEILAFLDDDTFPERDWLKNALRAMNTKNIYALGGPAITTTKDSFFKQISGLIYSSKLMSGSHKCRYIPDKVHYVTDFPSCNFIITRELYNRVGGFDSEYWPGEDTILCNNIMKAKEKILYTPEALVYHHRRDLFFGHFKQLKNYAWHRGYFVKKYGGNSLEISYFIPSIFVLYTIFLIFSFIFNIPSGISRFIPFLDTTSITVLMCIPHSIYLISLLLSAISTLSIPKGIMKAIGIFMSHCCYGVYFIKGFFSK